MASRNRLISGDDSVLYRHILDTHAPEVGCPDLIPIFAVVEVGLGHLADKTDYDPVASGFDDLTSKLDPDMVVLLADPINKISYEINYESSRGGDSHVVVMELLKSLSSYPWEAKAVIALAAFTINYAEFWLVERLRSKNSTAKIIAILKVIPETTEAESSDVVGKFFDAVHILLSVMLQVTRCLIDISELPSKYISTQSPEMAAAVALIPSAVYWIIRGIFACASSVSIVADVRYRYSTADHWEMHALAHKHSIILEILKNQLQSCHKLVEKNKAENEDAVFKELVKSAQADNMRSLRAFFLKENEKPIYDGIKRTKEPLDVLRGKHILLLISDVELPPADLAMLEMIQFQRSINYEILWLPVPVSDSRNTMFEDLQNNMTWFSAAHPSAIEPVAIRYIRQDLHFKNTTMLTVLEPNGRLSDHDALPMVRIWGAAAFPFTRERESKLWDESEWSIHLIADAIYPRLPEWIETHKVVCLYGGDDIEWIRKFSMLARTAARDLNVDLEMLYVGKRNTKEKVRRCHEVIAAENLSNIFATDYYDYVWYFWVRISSMLFSKKQVGKTVEDDSVMRGILDLLTYDSSERGWAVFSGANNEITMASGDKLLPILESYTTWGYEVDVPEKFVPVLDKHLRGYQPEHHCHRLILPRQCGYIPEKVSCSECGKTMGKYFMYRCCDD